jgi:CO/xanthine dehydrogenase FAD-binding subunit
MIEVINQSRDEWRECLSIDTNETVQAVYQHPRLPIGLRRVLEGVVSWQKRNELKVGTGLRSFPSYAAALLAWGAMAVSDKEEPLAAFLERGAAIGKMTAILIPLDIPGRVWGESHVSRTPADTPIVSAFAAVDLSAGHAKRVRLALTGVWEENVHLAKSPEVLVGKPLNPSTIADAVSSLANEVTPKSNYLGSAEYRRAMAQVTARRALEICMQGGKLA